MNTIITYVVHGDAPLFEDTSDIIFEKRTDLPLLKEIKDALLIDPSKDNENNTIMFLKELRKHSINFLLPVFFTSAPSDILQSLSNGSIRTVSELKSQMTHFRNRKQQIHPSDMTRQDARILAYSYTFQCNFKPHPNDLMPYYYCFPLAEALADDGDDVLEWLELLVQKGFLAREMTIDRVRTCPECNSAHLNYLDICPSCRSLRIQKSVFLHCFTCGHVAPQTGFIARDILQCPNCRTKLRHIGSDYDRALETYSCKDCASIFAEPHIVVRCMKCGVQTEPEKLIPMEICSYALSPKGEAVALVGWQDTPFSLLDEINLATLDYFTSVLSWLIQLQKRYHDETFSILGLRFLNLETLAQNMGSSGLAKLLDAFAIRLRSLIRITDIVSRSRPDIIWLILPRTPLEGRELLQSRVLQLIEDTRQEDGSGVMIAQAAWTIDSANDFEDPGFLLAHLTTLLDSD